MPAHDYMGEVEFDIPYPPSTNTIWRRGRNSTYLNPAYRKWKAKADEMLSGQRNGKGWRTITGPFEVKILLPLTKRFKTDLDNRVKGVLDWAKQAGLISDDKFQNKVVLEWADITAGAHVTLTPVQVLP